MKNTILVMALSLTVGLPSMGFAANPYEPLEIPTPQSSTLGMEIVGLSLQLKSLCDSYDSDDVVVSAKLRGDAKTPASTQLDVLLKPLTSTTDSQQVGGEFLLLSSACNALHDTATTLPTQGSLNTLNQFLAADNAKRILVMTTVSRLTEAIKNEAKHGLLNTWKNAIGIETKPGPAHSPIAAATSMIAPGLSADIASGLTEFLVARFKEEAQLFLQERVGALCKDNIPTLNPTVQVHAFFPNTCAVFTQRETTNINLYSFGQRIREAARSDLERLPDRVLYQLQMDIATDSQLEIPILMARVFLAFGHGLKDQRAPLDLIAGLADLDKSMACPDNKSDCTNAVGTLSELGTLVGALTPAIQRMSESDDKTKELPYVLTVLMYKKAELKLDKILGSKLDEQWAKLIHIYQLGREVIALYTENNDKYAENNDLGDKKTMTQKQLVRSALRIQLRLLHLVTLTDDKNIARKIRTLSEIGYLAVAKDYGAAVTVALDEIPALDPLRPLYALALELARAKSSDEVVKALQVAAAPAGGYKQKYQRHMLSITGYVGAAVYFDRASFDDAKLASFQDEVGAVNDISLYPAGMLGIHQSYPLNDNLHIGGFISVLDVGALVRARLSEEKKQTMTTDATPEDIEVTSETNNRVGLGQVFAPGLYLTLGLGKSPVTVLAGISYVPELHRIQAESDSQRSTVEGGALRYGVSIALDLTLFPF